MQSFVHVLLDRHNDDSNKLVFGENSEMTTFLHINAGPVHVCESHTHTIRGQSRVDTCIGPLIISYNMCVRFTHITYYKRINTMSTRD